MNNRPSQKEIQELQILEQNLQNILMQKQAFQSQLLESENALEEINKSKDKVYKIVGATVIESKKEILTSELDERINLLNLRIKSIEKQEKQLKEKLEKLQKEVLKNLENGQQNNTNN